MKKSTFTADTDPCFFRLRGERWTAGDGFGLQMVEQRGDVENGPRSPVGKLSPQASKSQGFITRSVSPVSIAAFDLLPYAAITAATRGRSGNPPHACRTSVSCRLNRARYCPAARRTRWCGAVAWHGGTSPYWIRCPLRINRNSKTRIDPARVEQSSISPRCQSASLRSRSAGPVPIE